MPGKASVLPLSLPRYPARSVTMVRPSSDLGEQVTVTTAIEQLELDETFGVQFPALPVGQRSGLLVRSVACSIKQKDRT